ncbi:heme biosynthesis protein HemY [Pseudochrobactrum sp. MP213Fo]|uniref:heme biosynthesis protein HemY n=1 Tax=Pseudochrobactrum sp. MP213Fo TaxID=3022250 RepID=UPI003BA38A0D
MIRVILFLVAVAALGLGFGWLADRPGDLVFTFAGQRYHITLMVAASMIVAAIAAVMLLWWMVKNLIRSPYILQRHFRARKRDRGYQSLSTGLLAAGAGDAETARRMSKQAAGLLRADQEPLIRLLDVQTAILEGRKDDVRKHFEAMIADPETKLLGLRGLYLEASRENVREAAFQYAKEASTLAPQLEWASNAVLGHKVLEGDIQGGLRVLEARKSTIPYGKDGKIARETLKRDRAALLSAQAMALFDSDPVAARQASAEAYKLEPDFIPAALIAARCLLRDGNIRKGNRILEAAWKREPNPEIADIYVHGRSGDTALDRLKKARHLAALRMNNASSCLIVAQAALDAGELTLARDNAEAALKLNPRRSVYLLMADIEEAQTGEQGRVREWLARALKAPRDPAWTADGVVSSQWAPVSPVTGRLNAFEWKVPLAEMEVSGAPVLDNLDLFEDSPVASKSKMPVSLQPTSLPVVPVVIDAKHARDDIEEAETLPAVAAVSANTSEQTGKSADLRNAKVTILSDSTDDPLAVAARLQNKAKPKYDSDDEHHHHLSVDDPGVAGESNTAKKKSNNLRLF